VSLFRRRPKPATPPGTPVWRSGSLPEPVTRPLPAPLEASFSEPETLLGAGSAASLGIYATILTVGPFVGAAPAFWTATGTAITILQATGWAATIGIGVTSRFRSFRIMGWSTALGVSALYLWKQASGLPAYSFFGLVGALSLTMNLGNLAAWWIARRRNDGR